jgi:Leucine-rich repeat (LRR) protein
LAGNQLTSISNDTFVDADNIHILNLAHNSITTVEVGALSVLQELRALRLDTNKLEDINGLVSSLGKLQWLNVSSNALAWFDYAFISSSLEWLDVSHNQLAELGNFYELGQFGIKTIDASFNKIRRLHPKSFPEGLQSVDVRGNEVIEVEPFTFANQEGLRKVDLSGNQIVRLLPDALRINSRAGN